MNIDTEKACCAHLTVKWQTETTDGLTHGWWACKDCGALFNPVALVKKAAEAEVDVSAICTCGHPLAAHCIGKSACNIGLCMCSSFIPASQPPIKPCEENGKLQAEDLLPFMKMLMEVLPDGTPRKRIIERMNAELNKLEERKGG